MPIEMRKCTCGAPLTTMHLSKSPQCWTEEMQTHELDLPFDDVNEVDDKLDVGPGARAVQRDELQAAVSKHLLKLRFEYKLSDTAVNEVKALVRTVQAHTARHANFVLASHFKPGVDPQMVERTLKPDPFRNLTTHKQELSTAGRNKPVLTLREVTLSKGNVVGSFDIAELLTRKLQNDSTARKQMMEVSERLKSGTMHNTMPTGEIKDALDGAVARGHAHMCRKATEEEVHDLRVPLMWQADDVEVHRTRARRCTPLSIPAVG